MGVCVWGGGGKEAVWKHFMGILQHYSATCNLSIILPPLYPTKFAPKTVRWPRDMKKIQWNSNLKPVPYKTHAMVSFLVP